MDRSGGVTSEMLDCMGAEFTRQDARLNENYKRLMSKLSAKRKEALLDFWPRRRHSRCTVTIDGDRSVPQALSSNHLPSSSQRGRANVPLAAIVRRTFCRKIIKW